MEMGQSSIGRSTGRPVVNLPAEMYEGKKPKGKSPGFISRLLGLERVRSTRHVPRQQKVPSESYQQNSTSINIQTDRQFNGSRSNRWGIMELQESEDVYEKLESSHLMNRRYSSKWSASSMLSKSDMALIRQQKVMDTKHLSKGKIVLDPKKLENTFDLPNSKELLANYQRKPNFSSAKILRDLQANPRSSWSTRLSVLKQSNCGIFEDSMKAWITERGSSRKLATSHLEREDGLLLEPKYRCRARISKIQYEEKDGREMPPTNIVVLKPKNSGMLGSLCGDSHGYVPNFREISEYPRARGGQNVSWRRKVSSCSEGFSKEVEEIAKEVTRQVRDACDEIADAKSFLLRGYAADESSFDAEESDSDSESEMFALPSRNSFSYDKQWYGYPPAAPVESVNRETKEKQFERWKGTQIASNGSSRGQMRSTPDGETRSLHLNAKRNLGGVNSQLGSSSGSSMWKGPLAIGRKHSWKGEILGTDCRLRLNSPVASCSNKTGVQRDALVKKKDHMCNDTMHYSRSKFGQESQKEKLASNDMKSSSKKPFTCHCHYMYEMVTLMQTDFEIKMEAKVKNIPPPHLTFQLASEDDCRASTASNVVIAEEESATLSSKSPQLHPERTSGVDEDESTVYDKVDFCDQEQQKEQPEEGGSSSSHHPGPWMASECSNEGDHTTCVSVIGVPLQKEQPEEGVSSLQHPGLQLAASECTNEGDNNNPVSVFAGPFSEGSSSLQKGQPVEGSSSLQHPGLQLDASECFNEADHTTTVSVPGVPFTEGSSSLPKGQPEEGSSSFQNPGPQLAASECSNEADRTSAVSVLRVPSTESGSSISENIERLNVEFHVLRIQLLLLRMDPTINEAFSVVQVEDIIAQLSSILSDGYYAYGSKGWEVWYAFDILIHSGIEQSGFDMFMLKWHSLDTPLDPNLIDDLEKKYGDDKFGMRPDRSLLFDKINAVLFDIVQLHIDMQPWVMPKAAGLRSMQKERSRDVLEKMLCQDSADGKVAERVLDKELQWTDYKEEIDMIGIEIENLFIDDLVAELLSDL